MNASTSYLQLLRRDHNQKYLNKKAAQERRLEAYAEELQREYRVAEQHPRVVYESAITGRFVTEAYARVNPHSTIRRTIVNASTPYMQLLRRDYNQKYRNKKAALERELVMFAEELRREYRVAEQLWRIQPQRVVYESAITGRFVTEAYARQNPRTTIRRTI